MNLQAIQTIARYEGKYIRRNISFAGITLVGILLIFLLQYLLQSREQSNYWFMVGLSSSIPFVNTYLFTILQSVLIIFFITEWRSREKHADTIVAMQTKDISNTEYILGKSLGIIFILLTINILSLAFAMGLNLWGSDSPFQLFPYIFYLLTLSLPSLLFLLGISMLTTAFVNRRGISILILFAFLCISLYILPEKQHGLFDYRATRLPNVFSDITGHVNLRGYLLQRLFFITLGIACIIYSIGREKRLPNNPRENSRAIISATGILFLGILTGISYSARFRTDDSIRAYYLKTALKNNANTPTRVTKQNITVRQQADRLLCHSQLEIINTATTPLTEIQLYLNPALEISRLSDERGNDIKFDRENQVLHLACTLNPQQPITLLIDYQGNIDDRVCYPEISPDDYRNDQFSNCPLHFGKRFAYSTKNYTLLTPECLWYPVITPPLNLVSPYATVKNFTRFQLKVIASPNQTVISQGQPEYRNDTTLFNPARNLTGLTLCIGEYEKKSIEVDSVTLELYTFKGHNHVAEMIKDLPEENLKQYLHEAKERFEFLHERQYPFSKFMLIETPVSFSSFNRKWANGNEFVQPEMILFPEKWITQHNTFLRQIIASTKIQIQQGAVNNKTWEQIYITHFLVPRLFGASVPIHSRNIFNLLPQKKRITSQKADNDQNITPLFSNFSNYLFSKDYPVMDRIIRLLETRKKMLPFGFEGSNEIFNATRYLSSHSLREAINDTTISLPVLDYVLRLKAKELLNRISLQISPEEFQHFIKNYKQEHLFQELSFDSLCSRITRKYDIHLDKIIPEWYAAQSIPSYIVKDINTKKIESDENARYRISFKIHNNSDTDGVISTSWGRDEKMHVYDIPAGTSWEIKEIVEENEIYSFHINLNLSHNIPSGISRNKHPEITETTPDFSHGKFAIEDKYFLPPSDEIIVDNEDVGFQINTSPQKKKLHLSPSGKREQERKYIYAHTLYNTQQLAVPTWTYCVGTEGFYGDIIRSATFKKSGEGNSPVEWKAALPKSGQYEIFVYIPIANHFNHQDDHKQYYTLTTREGEEKITLQIDPINTGSWESIGVFNLSAGENKIILSDKGSVPEQIIYADAVKWKYLK